MEFLHILATPENILSLLTLTVMEIVLGVDNLIFISIVSDRLPKQDQKKARAIGLSLALIMRVALLLGISWIAGLIAPLFTVLEHGVTGRDLILFCGGLFLLGKSTIEIHNKTEGEEDAGNGAPVSFWGIIGQIVLLDVVFSFDSVITAIGLVDHVSIMIIAIVISMIIMYISASSISSFINRHPTIKMLALAFLLMIGLLLVAESFHVHVPRGYVYFAMAFSAFVETLNIKTVRRRK